MDDRMNLSSLRRILLLSGLILLLDQARAAEGPLWILLSAPDLSPAMEKLAAQRKEERFRVLVLDSALAADGGKAAAAIKSAAAGAAGPVYVVLAGTADQSAPAGIRMPTLHGTQGRMKALFSDHGYSLAGGGEMPRAAVGRLPARSAEEARQMVEKILGFEKSSGAEEWRQRITALIGHPGGSSPLEKTFAAGYVNTAVGSRIASLHPRWTARVTTDVPGSPWLLEKPKLETEFLRQAGEGSLLFLYMGHSGPDALYSDGVSLLGTKSWQQAKFPHAGVFFSCGCYSLAPQSARSEGHGYTAMRNPAGPAAFIGAVDISYSTAGQLAFDGLLTLLQKEEPPALLADWWLAAMQGLASGKIDAASFAMLDMADGSGGAVPLEAQRREHLEMWQLLGDPAMRLPLIPATVKLTGPAKIAPGATLTISGELPAPLTGPDMTFTLERPPGIVVPGSDYLKANDPVIVRRKEAVKNLMIYSVELTVPADYRAGSIVVRALADTGRGPAIGVFRVKVESP